MMTPEEAMWLVVNKHQIHAHRCTCGFKSYVSRERTEHIIQMYIATQKKYAPVAEW